MSDYNINSISSKPVYHAKLFDVEEYKINFKNGREVVHHVVSRKPTVSVFPITEKYEIYLVSQYRYTLKRVTLEAMAGFIENGEKPFEAAKRELKEETGITASQWELMTNIAMAGSVFKAQSHLFLARDLVIGSQQQEEDEEIEVVKMSLDEAVQKVMLGEMNTSATMIGILMLDKMRKEKKL